MEQKFLVITPTDDGDVFTQVMTKSELLLDLAETCGPDIKPECRKTFLSEPPEVNAAEWGCGQVLITRFSPVMPKPVETVTVWEVE